MAACRPPITLNNNQSLCGLRGPLGLKGWALGRLRLKRLKTCHVHVVRLLTAPLDDAGAPQRQDGRWLELFGHGAGGEGEGVCTREEWGGCLWWAVVILRGYNHAPLTGA